MKIAATNRKAFHDYIIEEQYEAGIVLEGAEVKSLRQHGCSLQEAYGRPIGNEIYIIGMRITPYEKATVDIPDADRTRKLLLNRGEIDYITSRCTQRGYTLVPLKVYFRKGWAKVQLGLARRKRKEDKRRKLIERQELKEAGRHIRRNRS